MMAKKRKKQTESDMPSITINGESEREWRAHDDLRTIERAHQIIGDSERMTAVKNCAKKQKESLERISRLNGKRL